MYENNLTISGTVSHISTKKGRALLCFINNKCPGITFRAFFPQSDDQLLKKIMVDDTIVIEAQIGRITPWEYGDNLDLWNPQILRAARSIVSEEVIVPIEDDNKAIEVDTLSQEKELK